MEKSMQISEEEKNELLEDGKNVHRREEFRRLRAPEEIKRHSLDDYIQYLMQIQKVFGPFIVSDKRIITRMNKL